MKIRCSLCLFFSIGVEYCKTILHNPLTLYQYINLYKNVYHSLVLFLSLFASCKEGEEIP